MSDILLRIKKDKVYHGLNGKSIRKVNQVFTRGERKKLAALGKEIVDRNIKCPQCAATMADLGRDFKAPKKNALKEWEIVQGLVTTGKQFHSCGCEGIGYIPKSLRDYSLYLTRVLHDYQNHLAYYQKQTREENPGKQEAVAYWTTKIKIINAEISRQKT